MTVKVESSPKTEPNVLTLKKMYEFVTSNLEGPETLMHKVFLDVVVYMGRRGRECLQKLTKTHLKLKTMMKAESKWA